MKLEHSILFFGDLHSGFDHCLSIVKTYRPKAIILLGDIQATMTLDQHLKEVSALTEVWWIHGNHDTGTEDYYDYLFQSKLADKCLDGKVQEIAGYKVAGLGGIFRGKIWYPKAS